MRLAITFVLLLLSVSLTQAQLSFSTITGPMTSNGSSKNGSSWIDYDNDGDLDLYLSQSSGVNYLYENDGSGGFSLAPSAMDLSSYPSMGSSWGDYDNDGDLDVFMACRYANNRLYTNNGGGSFTEITTGDIVNDGGASNNASWVDYDNDGFLDVYVINRDSEVNFLYQGNGDGTFNKITTGDIVSDGDHFTTDVWADVNLDGYPEVFVANHDGANFIYKNNGDGTFMGVPSGNLVTNIAVSRTASWGDIDNDGDFDLFVGNGSNQSDVVYINRGNGKFSFHPMGDNHSANASAFGDFNNDGWLDLFVGNISGGNDLYINNGMGAVDLFTDSPISLDGASADGVSLGDFDRDGDLDIYVPNWFSDDHFYRNELTAQNKWIHLKLEGVVSNRAAIGAIVRVKATIDGNPRWQTRQVVAQSGRHAQNSLEVEYGIGDATIVDSIVVYWPSGMVCTLTNVATNQLLDISETCAGPIPADPEVVDESVKEVLVEINDLEIIPNPASNQISIQLGSECPGEKSLQIFSILGELVVSFTDVNQALHQLDISKLNSGTYQVRYSCGEVVSSSTFIKE